MRDRLRTGMLWTVAVGSIGVGLLGGALQPVITVQEERSQKADVQRLAASQHLAAGDPGEATRAALESLTLDPDDPASWELLGDLRSRQERWNEAEAAFERASELDGHRFVPWLQLGKIRRLQGRHESAREAIAKARELRPDSPEAAAEAAILAEGRGEHRRAIDLFEEAIRGARPDRRASYAARLAAIHQQQGDHDAAAAALGKAATADPENAARWAQVAEAYLRLGRTEIAAAALERQAALAGKPEVWERLGELQRARLAHEEAFAAYQRANEKGDRPAAWLGIARLRLLTGDETGAASAADRAYAARGKDERRETAVALGQLLVEMGRSGEASRILQPLVAATGESGLVDLLARAQAGAGQERKALATCRGIRLQEGAEVPGPFCQALVSHNRG